MLLLTKPLATINKNALNVIVPMIPANSRSTFPPYPTPRIAYPVPTNANAVSSALVSWNQRLSCSNLFPPPFLDAPSSLSTSRILRDSATASRHGPKIEKIDRIRPDQPKATSLSRAPSMNSSFVTEGFRYAFRFVLFCEKHVIVVDFGAHRNGGVDRGKGGDGSVGQVERGGKG